MDFAPEDAKGLAYIPSMAAGVLLAAPLLTLAFVGVGQAPCQLYTKSAALPGILAGIIWNAGNVSLSTHHHSHSILQNHTFKMASNVYTYLIEICAIGTII